jgi:hypothetical protein
LLYEAVAGMPGTPGPADEQHAIYRTWQAFVTNRLVSATTAAFPDTADVEHVAATGELPIDANQWRVRRSFVEQTGSSPPTRANFTCDLYLDGERIHEQLLGAA